MPRKKATYVPCYEETEEVISVKSEKNGILILLEKDEEKNKLVGTVSKVLEHIEADKYSDELFFGLLNKYFNNGENHKWIKVN